MRRLRPSEGGGLIEPMQCRKLRDALRDDLPPDASVI
jgi:hypothetical protein